MDRRSWLWRRKSSEQSPGETESSGSMSSHLERFSDDQVYPTETTPSPEVTCEAAPNDEEATDVKTLTEKLSIALLNSSAKEELVKQHAKVAEEAVSGWEKAENEVLILKQQLAASKQKNSVLENQVSHLNGALKECMRELRQAKEEQDQNIHEAVVGNSCGVSARSDLHQRLEDLEKENSNLKIELQSRLEELELRTIERDLSTQAAETASKQHLESIKKVTKLESECRRLKAMTRKTFSANDHRSLTASSVYVESFTDSMSDIGERQLVVESDMRKLGGWDENESEPSHYDSWSSTLISELDQVKSENTAEKNSIVFSTEINLMDDFLEMERLAALPDTESVSGFPVVGTASDQLNVGHGTRNAEVEAMVQKNAALEKKLEKMEADKHELEMDLTKCQKQLEASLSRVTEMELEVAELQTKLVLANKSNEEVFEELKATHKKKEIAESKLRVAQTEAEELVSKIYSLEEEIEKERAFSAENLARCGKLEDELLRMNHETQLQQNTEIMPGESVNSEMKQEKELALAANKFAECRKTIESLGLQLKSLATLEDLIHDSESPVELTCEVTPGSQNGGVQLKKLHSDDLSLSKGDSESSSVTLNPSITHEKARNSFGRFNPRSKSVSRTRGH
ncbi:filament-like plant protein 3 [Cajanus cajan]|uniref:filament-like plant protein 3 n=1 Tax=Cajanus cajan TaxID=3821 RepID=UPI00098D8C6C|nr:filament-like plant protein 3 [Cajanus cajan]XP_020221666.1 filament-like plant protein 3 [Cajanus cajan]XP_020221667.1 filament-like plant protein 3 [Cajanus cajan]XP_020221668.1 filament-like plant protein 3 [Cajanus cajan]XP_020221670.1 filament-like plant protein 3 [Cajanus cajan]XP_020221671.1 filament-like plant protein 3 [Cajanus cajan]